MQSKQEAVEQLIEAYVYLIENEEEEQLNTGQIQGLTQQGGLSLDNELYSPSEQLHEKIREYNSWYCTHAHGDGSDIDPGQLMEQLAALAFDCLRGLHSLKSYQSYAPQHDLVASGNDGYWIFFIWLLGLNPRRRTIVVEAKNTDTKVSDAQFGRLCGILQVKFTDQAYLGVFFSREGASGFPDPGEVTRQRQLTNARATQVIFHASTKKYVVVLNHQEILRLGEPGALVRLLRAKIQDVEETTGLPIEFDEEWNELEHLPAHIAEALNRPQQNS